MCIRVFFFPFALLVQPVFSLYLFVYDNNIARKKTTKSRKLREKKRKSKEQVGFIHLERKKRKKELFGRFCCYFFGVFFLLVTIAQYKKK